MAADSDGGSNEPNINESVINQHADDDSVTTIVTCEGDYYDPEFHDKFKQTLGKLENILCDERRKQTVLKNSPCRTTGSNSDSEKTNSENGGLLKISKLEPWNSVRVTLSIPREAAARLRQMANEGSAQLRQLGILSVQVEGDQVISLRIASRFGNENDAQEIVLNTTGGTSGPSAENPSSTLTTLSTAVTVDSEQQSSASNNQITRFLQASSSSSSTNQQAIPPTNPLSNGKQNNEFRSPNVVCPSDTQVPIKATTVSSNLVQTNVAGRPHETLNRPFPFASMQQAAIAIQNRTQQQDFHNFTANNRTAIQQNIVAQPTPGTPSQSIAISGNTFSQQPQPPPPPPYPSKVASNIQQSVTTPGQNIAISSPLLVNLLQNEGASQKQENDKTCKPVKVPVINNKTPIVQNIGNNSTGFVKTEINRVPPLPQTSANNSIIGTPYDSSMVANTVQTVQNVQTPSSTTVPSTQNLINKKLSLATSQPQRPNTIIVPPNSNTVVVPSQQPIPNPRLQQTQQLRNLQQQLIQQQNRLSNQQKLLSTSPVRTPITQNYRAPSTVVASPGTAVFNSNPTINTVVPQPPPYPGNRNISQQNNIRTSSDFQQNRFNQFSSTNVPDSVLPFGQSLANTNLQPIAQPMPHLGLVNQLNLDSSLSNITPSLTDLSKTDLDSLLPTLTDLDGTDLISDIAKDIVDNFDIDTTPASTIEPTPIDIPDELNSKGKKRLFLINPSNGQLEPMPSESSSSDESDTEDGEIKKNRKKGIMDVFSELNEQSNSIYSDDDTNSTATSKRGFGGDMTDQSDSENKLSESSSTKSHRQKSYVKGRRESPSILKTGKTLKEKTPTEKIKLRLKLEKSEPVNSAYKVDVSFVNRQEPKRANTSPTLKTIPTSPGVASFTNMSSMAGGSTEEPRVPPLHISLRGRNSVVISNKSSKKHLLKSGSEIIENCDEKLSKKSKIRKDKDGIKLKSRLYKEISGKNNYDYDQAMKIKAKEFDDITTLTTYQREPGEIVMPNLKALDSKSKLSKKLTSTTPLTPSTSASSMNPSDGEKSGLLSNELKNHKKKSEFSSSKLNFKSKIDKNKSKLDQIDIKKMEEIKSMNLKRVHSSPPGSGSTGSYLTEIPVAKNGLINSPDTKKRKLSDSILETGGPIIPTTVVCMNNIGSTNIGTIPTTSTTACTVPQTNNSGITSVMKDLLTTKNNYIAKVQQNLSSSSSTLLASRNKDKESRNNNISDIKIKDNLLESKAHIYANNRTGISSKSKDLNRDKTYSKIVAEKRLNQQEILKSKLLTNDQKIKNNKISALSLPTAGEIDMGAKFKQRLLEDTKPRNFIDDKTKKQLEHKRLGTKNTKVILNRMDDTILHNRLSMNKIEKSTDKLEDNLRQLLDEVPSNERNVDTEILGDINLAQILTDTDLDTKKEHDDSTKQSQISNQSQQSQPNRSPPLSNSTGQGEDSGIESMDALSEKSPNNQSSQSPHCHTEIISNLVDTLTGKDTVNTNKDLDQTPSDIDRLLKKSSQDLTELGDIEAELAKMEGYGQNGDNVTNELTHQALSHHEDDSNLVAQLKSELESSFNVDLTDKPHLQTEDDIFTHIKNFSDNNFLVKQNDVKDLNENQNKIDTIVPDECCSKKIEEKHLDDKIYEFTTDDKLLIVKKEEDVIDFKTSSTISKMDNTSDKSEDSITFKDNNDHLDLNHEDDFDPLPIRRTPPLYTYSNPDKQLSRNETDSPLVDLSDIDDNFEECNSDITSEDFNDLLDVEVKSNESSKLSILRRRKQIVGNCVRSSTNDTTVCIDNKQKSLLEQLLIEIPNSEFLDKSSFSHSPAISEKSLPKTTVRTRSASSKLNSPSEIVEKHNLRTPKHSPSVNLKVNETNSRANSPAISGSTPNRASPKTTQPIKGVKRKRRESESSTQSTQSVDDSTNLVTRKKLRNADNFEPKNSLIANKTIPTKKVTISKQQQLIQPQNKQINPSNRKCVEESSDSDEPLIEIAGKVRNMNVVNSTNKTVATSSTSVVNVTTNVATRNKLTNITSTVPTTGSTITTVSTSMVASSPVLVNKVTTNNNSPGTATTTPSSQKVDEQQKVAVGIRRSVRHNPASNIGGNNNQITLKTRSNKLNTAITPTTNNSITSTNLTTSTTENLASTDSTSTLSTIVNRRKTRSAVTESVQEKRTRRNSKDGK